MAVGTGATVVEVTGQGDGTTPAHVRIGGTSEVVPRQEVIRAACFPDGGDDGQLGKLM